MVVHFPFAGEGHAEKSLPVGPRDEGLTIWISCLIKLSRNLIEWDPHRLREADGMRSEGRKIEEPNPASKRGWNRELDS